MSECRFDQPSPRWSRAARSKSMAAAVVAVGLAAGSGQVLAEGPLDGATVRILGIGEGTVTLMEKHHEEVEGMVGGTVDLEIQPFDTLRQKVLLNAQQDTSSYDIIFLDMPQTGEYVAAGALLDLTDLVAASPEMNVADFYPAALEAGEVGGMQIGIPVMPQPELFFYRIDLFEAAGLSPPETTADVLAAAKKLHNPDGGVSGICNNFQRGTPLGQTFIQTLGAFGSPPIDLKASGDSFTDKDIDPENMRPLIDSSQGRAVADYLVAQMDYAAPGILNMAWDERTRVFGQGGCAMMYGWSTETPFEMDERSPARGNTGYVPHPRGPDAKIHVSTLGGWLLGIPKNIDPERIDLAWNMLKWMTSPETVKWYASYGDCSTTRVSVATDPGVRANCPVVSAANQMAERGQLHTWPRPPIIELQQVVDVLGAEMHKMVSGTASPEDAVNKSQSLLDRLMKKAGYY